MCVDAGSSHTLITATQLNIVLVTKNTKHFLQILDRVLVVPERPRLPLLGVGFVGATPEVQEFIWNTARAPCRGTTSWSILEQCICSLLDVFYHVGHGLRKGVLVDCLDDTTRCLVLAVYVHWLMLEKHHPLRISIGCCNLGLRSTFEKTTIAVLGLDFPGAAPQIQKKSIEKLCEQHDKERRHYRFWAIVQVLFWTCWAGVMAAYAWVSIWIDDYRQPPLMQ